jgi:predicted nucleic acid-binding protein
VIFADTSFWIGLFSARDDRRELALRLWSTRTSRGVVTTNHVRGETLTFIRSRVGYPAAIAFLDAIERAGRVTVVTVDEEQERAALTWLRRRDERVYSFVDATSFIMMQQLGLTEALAFDGDFSAAGFVELRE